MKNVLVTGAGGYIGTHVVKALLELGFSVVATDVCRVCVDERAKFVQCDLFSGEENLYELLGSPECIIHLAWKDGFVHNSETHLKTIGKHYEFIANIVRAGVKNVNVMGSMHEIGYYEGEIDVNTPQNPRSLYGIAKNALRQSLEVLSQSEEFSFKWLRGFYILGDDKRNNSIFAKILKAAEEGKTEFPFTSGTNKYDFIDVDELAFQISLASVQTQIEGIVNCCSGNPVALKDKVEGFIKQNCPQMKLLYGVYPDRVYDSKIIYGNNENITKILINSKEIYGEEIKGKINEMLCKTLKKA